MSRFVLGAAGLVVALAAGGVSGQVTWDGSCGDAFWFGCCSPTANTRDTNWALGVISAQTCSTAQYPQPADDVDIGSNHVVLGCCGTSTVNSFISGGQFEITGGQILTVATTGTYNGPLLIDQGGLAGGHHDIKGGLTISGNGSTGGMSVTGLAAVTLNSNTVWTGLNSFTIEHGSSVTNPAGKTLDAQTDSTMGGTGTTPPTPPIFNNAGTFRKSGTSGGAT